MKKKKESIIMRQAKWKLMRLRLRISALLASHWFVTFWTLLHLNKQEVVSFLEILSFATYLSIIALIVGVGAHKQVILYKETKRKSRLLNKEKGGDNL